MHKSLQAMRRSFALSASRTSIHFGGTDQYQLAPEASRRSGGAKLPSGWQGQPYFENGHARLVKHHLRCYEAAITITVLITIAI